MKKFSKVITVLLIVFVIVFVLGFIKFNSLYEDVLNDTEKVNDDWFDNQPKQNDNINNDNNTSNEGNNVVEKIDPRLEAIKENKNRVNFVAMGIGNMTPLADTIMVISCDIDSNDIDIISIPRDTYYHVEGYDSGGHRKINAAYAREREKGIVEATSDILGIPIHQYVSIRYKGVQEIVDIIGGVPVNVPFDMKYEDISDTPPLFIDIPKGYQVLDGETAIKYLRYRHGNEKDENGNFIEGYYNQDLGRIKAQQKFVISAIKKSIGLDLPKVIKKGFESVKTDMTFDETLFFLKEFGNIDTEKISNYSLPGEAKNIRINNQLVAYFEYNEDKTKELIDKIYKIEIEQ